MWAANGSNEVMLHLLQAFGGPGRTAISFAPTYSMYPEYARDTNTRWVVGQRETDFALDPTRARRAGRRAPAQRGAAALAQQPDRDGAAAPTSSRRSARRRATGCVVVDEAYAEFRRAGTPSALELLPGLRNLVVTRTMSKAFAFAGARLGYLAAAPEICDAIRVVRLPYHLSRRHPGRRRWPRCGTPTSCSAGSTTCATERDELAGWLAGRGLEVAESDANFVLFGRYADRHAVWQGLLDQGVLIRETGPDGWLRVSVGTPEEMAAFRDALTSLGESQRMESR